VVEASKFGMTSRQARAVSQLAETQPEIHTEMVNPKLVKTKTNKDNERRESALKNYIA